MSDSVRLAIDRWWWQLRWFAAWRDRTGVAYAYKTLRVLYEEEDITLSEMLVLSGAVC